MEHAEEKATTYRSNVTRNVTGDITSEYELKCFQQWSISLQTPVAAFLAAASILYHARTIDKKLKWTNLLIAVASSILFLGSSLMLVEVMTLHYTSFMCNTIFIGNAVLSRTGRALVGVVLWLRQIKLFAMPIVTWTTTKVVANIVSLVAVTVMCLIPVVGAAFMNNHPIIPRLTGCYYPASHNNSVDVLLMSLGTFCLGVLLVMALLPFVNHFCSTEQPINAKVRRVFTRVVLSSLFCFVNHTTMIFIIAYFRDIFDQTSPDSIGFVLTNAASILSLASIVLSFHDGARRLNPLVHWKSIASVSPILVQT